MAITDNASIIADWPPEGLAPEAAIERHIGQLGSLLEAATAWRAIAGRVAAKRLAGYQGDPTLTLEEQRIVASLEREQTRLISPFLQKLKSGEWVATIWPWDDLRAEPIPLRPDDVARLRVTALNDLLKIVGPDKRRLKMLIWPAGQMPKPVPQPIPITGSITLEQVIPKKRKEPAYYEDIRRAARELFPTGWQHERPTVVLGAVGKATKQNRDAIQRALKLRKN